jgi:hypothetical protein
MKCGKSSGMVHGCKMDYGSRELSLGGTEYIPLDEVGTDNFKREPVATSRQPDHNTSRHGKDFFLVDVATSASVACLERLWMSENLYARGMLSLNQTILLHSAVEAEL